MPCQDSKLFRASFAVARHKQVPVADVNLEAVQGCPHEVGNKQMFAKWSIAIHKVCLHPTTCVTVGRAQDPDPCEDV